MSESGMSSDEDLVLKMVHSDGHITWKWMA